MLSVCLHKKKTNLPRTKVFFFGFHLVCFKWFGLGSLALRHSLHKENRKHQAFTRKGVSLAKALFSLFMPLHG